MLINCILTAANYVLMYTVKSLRRITLQFELINIYQPNKKEYGGGAAKLGIGAVMEKLRKASVLD